MTARPIKTSSGPFNAGPIESQDGQPVKMFRIAVFAAVACACIRINAGGRDDDADNVCSLPTIGKQALVMPILFTTDGPRNTVVYPDDEGCLRLKKGQSFKLSCTTVKFVSKDFEEVSDVQVTCEGGDRLGYKGQTYRYENFKCNAMPKSQLRVTGETCQPKGYTVAEVGFRTQDAFIGLYRVCFDKSTKNSLYTWYVARSPYYDNRQKTGGRPRFARSRELYGNTDVDKKYSIVEQRKTVSEILKSNKLGEKYLLDDGKHSLSRGHYAANADFFFGYEQFATFYYANAAPQWQIFNGHKWADVENNTRKTLAGAMNNDDGWLIVTGTYRLCMLPDKDKQQRPLFLDPPSSIPVPLFYWKMVLNRFTKDGIVYIGLNNPHKVIDDSLYLCPNTCPGAYDYGQAGVDANPGLIYCCTKESFENFYGKLDPIVYRQF